ncbi:hypothetical protein IR215_10395 [Simulacricoccus sp. 17bor-14]|nr:MULTISPECIES: hypothetical protein [Myxococcaceae]MBF5042796.1 hypothetical protein [Simulacricoccus sp. 17bor-14]
MLVGALALALLLLSPRLLSLSAGPRAEILTALKSLEQRGLELSVPGSPQPLRSRTVHFSRLSVGPADGAGPPGAAALARATLDFEGALGATKVSSVGVEQVPFAPGASGSGGVARWRPVASAAPRLVAVVAALEARRQALEAGDRTRLAALSAGGAPQGAAPKASEEALAQVLSVQDRDYRAEAWYVRLERDEASVGEHWHLTGSAPGGSRVDLRGERRLLLVRRGEEFFFSPGVM